MRGHDPELVRDPELVSSAVACSRHREVRAAAADDPDERIEPGRHLLALRPGERLDAVEDVELLDVSPAGVAGGHAGLEVEQLGVDRVAAADGDEPGAEQPDRIGAEPDRRVDLRAPALDELEAVGTAGQALELGPEDIGRDLRGDEDVEADGSLVDPGVPIGAVRPRRQRGRGGPAGLANRRGARCSGRLPRLAMTASV